MISQLLLGFFGVIAVFLSQSANTNLRRYACLFGLAAQPFWFYTTFIHGQWGIFGLSFFYTASWLQGFYTNWVMKSS